MNPRSQPEGRVGLWRTAPTQSRTAHVDGSLFDWLERTNEPQFETIRERIEGLWLRIPEAHRPEFVSRLRSRRRSDFFSAYNELWFNKALEDGGIRCFIHEATVAGSLPDWRLHVGDEAAASAECYVRLEPERGSHNDAQQNRWFAATLRKLTNKRIRLWVHGRQCGNGQPSADRFAKYLDATATAPVMAVNHGSHLDIGHYSYDDGESGWALDFNLIVRTSDSSESAPQLLYSQCDDASWCKSKELLDEALSRKSRQHVVPLPVFICVGWNYFEHEPDLKDVHDIVGRRSRSFEANGVHGVFWAREVYPWNDTVAAPRLLHWKSDRAGPLLSAWRGAAIDVRLPMTT